MSSTWGSNGGRDAKSSRSTMDQTYGQRSVFGGISTAPVDEELDVEDEQDALEYLRLVRTEAGQIPHVLVAQKYGPQAFPAPIPPQKKKTTPKRRRRHWDEQDDNGGFTAKKRRVSQQQAVAVELSYDDEGQAPEDAEAPGDGALDYDEGNENGEIYEEEEEDKPPEKKETCSINRDIYETGVGDSRGYYHDGVYTAVAEDGGPNGANEAGHGNSNGDATSDASTDAFSNAYRAHLLARFVDLRTLLQQEPTDDALAQLPPDHDVFVGPLSTRSGVFRRWLHLLQTTDPWPAQIAAMDKVSAFRLVRVILRGLLAGTSSSSRSSRSARFSRSLGVSSDSSLGITPRTSRWLWALFARLPERGELTHHEVGYIRDVAKQAVMRLAHLSYDTEGLEAETGPEPEAEKGLQEYDEDWDEADLEDIAMEIDSEPEEETREETQVEQGQGQEETEDQTIGQCQGKDEELGQTQGHDQDADQNDDQDQDQKQEQADSEADGDMHQRATLEMVLAVTGEFYGQRDLLAFRSPWPVVAGER